MDSVSTYSEARNEYMKQLSTWITPYMITHFRTVWNDSVATGGQRRAMIVFQEKCAEIPKWNQDTIDTNVNKLLDSCRCDYLEELMAAVFIAHTKVLIAIRVSSKHKKLQITLPKLDHFIHRIFSECARSFWKAPFLFLDDVKPIEMQKNVLQAEALCGDAIASAVRSLLPIKNILNEYLSDDVLNSEPVIEQGETETKVGGSEPESETKAVSETAAVPAVPVPVPVSPVQEELKAKTDVKVTKIDETKAEVAKVDETKPEAPKVELPKVEVPKAEVPKVEVPKVEEPEELVVDTEPAVHFSNYDNVFDESAEQVASFKFVPKDDSEPHLEIREESAVPLSADASVTNLETPGDAGLVVDEILD
jgi:Family of unknown function (DUF5764)